MFNNQLGRGHDSADLYIVVLKNPKKMCINERQVKMDGIIQINYFHLKFKTKSAIKRTNKVRAVLKNICPKNFQHYHYRKVIISASVAEFIFSKIPCFQHILTNTSRRMRLNHEYCSLRCVLFQTLKEHCTSLIT